VYASNELCLPAGTQDLQTLLPLDDSSQEHCYIQDPFDGSTTKDPGIGSSRSGDIGHSGAFAAAEHYLDHRESIDSEHGGESDPEGFEEDNYVDFESLEKNERRNERCSSSSSPLENMGSLT
jgi:hypothetical protein